MPQYLSPAVYVEERDSGPRPIEGISTSAGAFVGWSPEGPVDEPTLITGFEQYSEVFGAGSPFVTESDLATHLYAFFANGGTRAWVVRASPSDAVKAVVSVYDNSVDLNKMFDVRLKGPGSFANGYQLVITGDPNYKQLAGAVETGWLRFSLMIADSDGNAIETHEGLSFNAKDSAQSYYFSTQVNDNSPKFEIVNVDTTVTHGNKLPDAFKGVQVAAESLTPDAAKEQTHTLANASACPGEVVISFTDDSASVTYLIKDDGAGALVGDILDQSGTNTINYTTGALSFKLNVMGDAAADTLDVAYFHNAASAALPTGTSTGTAVAASDKITWVLALGSNGTMSTLADRCVAAALVSSKLGMYALEDVDEVCTLVVPDIMEDNAKIDAMVAYAESRRIFFCPLWPLNSASTPANAVAWIRGQLDDTNTVAFSERSSYAAVYWPRLKVLDPAQGDQKVSWKGMGHIAGIYARNDEEFNVARAPAGLPATLKFSVGLAYTLSKGERDVMNPAHVNAIIDTTKTGRVVWGGRTASLNANWKYIQVRRLFMFLEKSIDDATQWAVFETNGQSLWQRIKGQLDSFLERLHNESYFAGETTSESFLVVCDDSNNPQANIDAGLVTIDVYVAPTKPAEFVRFRFSQKTLT